MNLRPGDLVKPMRRRGGAVERVIGVTDEHGVETVWLATIGSRTASAVPMDAIDTYWVKVDKRNGPS